MERAHVRVESRGPGPVRVQFMYVYGSEGKYGKFMYVCGPEGRYGKCMYVYGPEGRYDGSRMYACGPDPRMT